MHDDEVIDAMAKLDERPKASKPRLWGWTPVLSALRDIQDQLIASRGGRTFVPRPEIPGYVERWRRKDAKLQNTLDRICGK